MGKSGGRVKADFRPAGPATGCRNRRIAAGRRGRIDAGAARAFLLKGRLLEDL